MVYNSRPAPVLESVVMPGIHSSISIESQPKKESIDFQAVKAQIETLMQHARQGSNTLGNSVHLTHYAIEILESVLAGSTPKERKVSTDQSAPITPTYITRTTSPVKKETSMIDVDSGQVYRTRVSYQEINRALMQKALDANDIIYGDIALAHQSGGHVLAFCATATDVFYIDGRNYDGIKNRGDVLFSDFSAAKDSENNKAYYFENDITDDESVTMFENHLYYLVYGCKKLVVSAQRDASLDTGVAMSSSSSTVIVPAKPVNFLDATSTVASVLAIPETYSWVTLDGASSAVVAELKPHIIRVAFLSGALKDVVSKLPKHVFVVEFHDEVSSEVVAELKSNIRCVVFGPGSLKNVVSAKQMVSALRKSVCEVVFLCEVSSEVIAELPLSVVQVVFFLASLENVASTKEAVSALPKHVFKVEFQGVVSSDMVAELKSNITCVNFSSDSLKDVVKAKDIISKLPKHVLQVGFIGEVSSDAIAVLGSHVITVSFIGSHATKDMILALSPHIAFIRYSGANAEIINLVKQRKKIPLSQVLASQSSIASESSTQIVLDHDVSMNFISELGSHRTTVVFTGASLPTVAKVKVLPYHIKCVEFSCVSAAILRLLKPGVILILADSPTVTKEALLAVPTWVTTILYRGSQPSIQEIIRQRSLSLQWSRHTTRSSQKWYWLTYATTVADISVMPESVSYVILEWVRPEVIAALKSHVNIVLFYDNATRQMVDAMPPHIQVIESYGMPVAAIRALKSHVGGVVFFSTPTTAAVKALSRSVCYVVWHHAEPDSVRALKPQVTKVGFINRSAQDSEMALALPATVSAVELANSDPGFIRYLKPSVKTVKLYSNVTEGMVSAVPHYIALVVYDGTNADIIAAVARRNQFVASISSSLSLRSYLMPPVLQELNHALSSDAVIQELSDALGPPTQTDHHNSTKRKIESTQASAAFSDANQSQYTRNSLFDANESDVKIKQEPGTSSSSSDVKIKQEPDTSSSSQPKKVRPNDSVKRESPC